MVHFHMVIFCARPLLRSMLQKFRLETSDEKIAENCGKLRKIAEKIAENCDNFSWTWKNFRGSAAGTVMVSQVVGVTFGQFWVEIGPNGSRMQF